MMTSTQPPILQRKKFNVTSGQQPPLSTKSEWSKVSLKRHGLALIETTPTDMQGTISPGDCMNKVEMWLKFMAHMRTHALMDHIPPSGQEEGKRMQLEQTYESVSAVASQQHSLPAKLLFTQKATIAV